MTRYILTSIRTGNELDVTYNDEGFLWAVSLNGNYSLDEHTAVWQLMPTQKADMQKLSIKNVHIKEVMPDLSFERFYKAYKYPVDRKRAEAIWNRMTDTNRMKAIECIAEYDKYLGRSGIAKAYPKTFLGNEYFHTDYKKLK